MSESQYKKISDILAKVVHHPRFRDATGAITINILLNKGGIRGARVKLSMPDLIVSGVTVADSTAMQTLAELMEY